MLKLVYSVLLNDVHSRLINLNKLKYNFFLKNCWKINSTSKNRY